MEPKEFRIMGIGAAIYLALSGLIALLLGCVLLYIALEADALSVCGIPGLVLAGGGALCFLPLIYELRRKG